MTEARNDVTTSFAVSRGYRLAYEVTGRGTPVLLLHGFLGSRRAWDGYVDELVGAGCLVVRFDALGHGESDKPHEVDAYRTADRAADAMAVLAAAGIDGAHVWGYSMGGRNAYATAVHFPERTRSLIAGGAAPEPEGEDREDPWMRARAAALLASDWERFWGLMGAVPGAAWRAATESANDPVALGAVSLGLLEWATRDPATLNVPSLHYAGDADPFVERVRWAAGASGGSLHVLAGLDHLTGMTRADVVLPLVLDHLLAAR